jgi:ureidoacrylate peracid hydrolase
MKREDLLELVIPADPETIRVVVARSALLVIDMQNAFISREGYLALTGHVATEREKIVQPCREIINKARAEGIKVIYLQMIYRPRPSDGGNLDSPYFFKSRAMKLMNRQPDLKEKFYLEGSWGAEIIKELRPQPGDIIVQKQKYDAFIETDLDIQLKTHGIRYLLFVGTATNICVESTLRHAFFMDYFPILVSDAVAPLGPKGAQEATLLNVKSTFGWVTDSKSLLEALNLTFQSTSPKERTKA